MQSSNPITIGHHSLLRDESYWMLKCMVSESHNATPYKLFSCVLKRLENLGTSVTQAPSPEVFFSEKNLRTCIQVLQLMTIFFLQFNHHCYHPVVSTSIQFFTMVQVSELIRFYYDNPLCLFDDTVLSFFQYVFDSVYVDFINLLSLSI